MTLKNKIKKEVVLGTFSKTTDSSFIESLGIVGFDFVILDMEHGVVSLEKLHDHIRAAKCAGIEVIVRTKDASHHSIGSALDAGADGIQVPSVSSFQEAQSIIESSKFYPLGERGVCRFVRAADYGVKEKCDYFSEANEKLVIVQVEGMEGISQVEQIMTLPAIDIIFIGPYDLSQSLGVPGDVMSELVQSEIKKLIEIAGKNNVVIGCFADTPESMLWLKSLGVKYIAYSVDTNLFIEGCLSVKRIFQEGD